MIFGLHYFLIGGGYSAAGVLLGAYMSRYAAATEWDLGFIFMIQPVTILARPLISARADRQQAHKKMLVMCLIGNSLSYVPFVTIPFLMNYLPHIQEYLTPRVCFWIFAASHISGSFCFCGVRSLGDALTVNYAKRIGSNFTSYRKFGALSFGSFGFLLGHINENWYLPDFVPTFLVHVTFLALNSMLIYLWPDDYFVIVSEKDTEQGQLPPLASYNEVWNHMGSKLVRTLKGCFCLGCNKSSADIQSGNYLNNRYPKQIGSHQVNKKAGSEIASNAPGKDCKPKYSLTTSQQVKILWLLFCHDLRIPMYLSVLFFGGMIGYAPQNFVFTYLDQVCHFKSICDSASLAGLVIISFCLSETLCYVTIAAIRPGNFVCLLEIGLLSYSIHYFFYGLVLDKVSPYFFLVESLHGLEYSTSLSTGIELGYKFANEVDLIIPQLIERKIISEDDDQELVKVSLMATMNSCFTLIFEGAGTILGAFACGFIIDTYSFNVAWNVCGGLAAGGFLLVIAVVMMGKCIRWKPQILKLTENKQIDCY